MPFRKNYKSTHFWTGCPRVGRLVLALLEQPVYGEDGETVVSQCVAHGKFECVKFSKEWEMY